MKMSTLSLSLCLTGLLFCVCSTSELASLQGNCAAGWLDGGATLGCIYLDSTARTWMDSVMYCRGLSVSGVSTTIGLARIGR